MILIIVESPTKAKALTEYLKNEKNKYTILSSYGHIRNLLKKSGSINTQNGYEYKWETTQQWEKYKDAILKQALKAEKIIIASDLDREGEGIAWHIQEVLKNNGVSAQFERIIFNSISKDSILEALKNPQSVRTGLVESYLARIGVDYIFGFSISPILWHKIPCCKSAGRVQSVALRIIVEEENKILQFVPKQYITIHAKFKESNIEGTLVELNSEKIADAQIFDDNTIKNADQLCKKLKNEQYTIASIKQQKQKVSSPAPFITSTLQQAASSELNFSPSMTMQLAQKLYEGATINGQHVGFITYMRTDSVHIDKDFIPKIRAKIKSKFGDTYVPEKPKIYKTASKNAQEAHEAIRVLDINLEHPSLDNPNLEKLYKLIWQRTMMSQMADATLENMNIKAKSDSAVFEIKTSRIAFDGFKILQKKEEKEALLQNTLTENQILSIDKIYSKDHETQPPKRFSEASLINALEKQGIGRPSTYAKIIQTLYERDYAKKEKKIIMPTQKGFIVTAFMKEYFKDEVEYSFTASMEEALDELSHSSNSHITILDKFWTKLSNEIKIASIKTPHEVSEQIQKQFGQYFLESEKKCDKCGGILSLKVTKYGAILSCNNYPDCKNLINIGQGDLPHAIDLGSEEEAQFAIKTGPYGPYIEINEPAGKKRIAVPKIWQKDLNELTLEQAKFLASMPITIGEHNNETMTLSSGRFGCFVKCGSVFVSVKDPMVIDKQAIIAAIDKKLQQPSKTKK